MSTKVTACLLHGCVKRPAACFCGWLVPPLAALLLVVPLMSITDPEVGWRIHGNDIATSLDALELLVNSHEPPPPPPWQPPFPQQPQEASRHRDIPWGAVDLMFTKQDGGDKSSLLTAAAVSEGIRLEQWVLRRFQQYCLLSPEQRCEPPVSFYGLFTSASGEPSCDVSGSAQMPLTDHCVQRRMNLSHHTLQQLHANPQLAGALLSLLGCAGPHFFSAVLPGLPTLVFSNPALVAAMLPCDSADVQRALSAPVVKHLLHADATDREAVLRLLQRAPLSTLIGSSSRDWNGTHASALKSYVLLGLPLAGYTSRSATDHHDAAYGSQLRQLREFLHAGFTTKLRAEAAAGKQLDVVYYVSGCQDTVGSYLQWLGRRTLMGDLAHAAISLVCVYVCICIHTQSLLLGTLGVLQIALSFPLALAFYRLLLGIQLFGVMHAIGVYVIIGIGCDDIFILTDAWRQAWMQPASIIHPQSGTEGRLAWAFARAVRAMAVTTVTNTLAFLSSLICIVPNLASFAVFTALLVAANFWLVCTMWPSVLMLHHRHFGRQFVSGLLASDAIRSDTATAETAAPVVPAADSPCPTECIVEMAVVSTPAAARDTCLPAEAVVGGDKGPPGQARPGGKGGSPGVKTEARESTQPHLRGRLVERWYARVFVPWLVRGWHSPLLVLFLGALSLVSGWVAGGLQQANIDVLIWPRNSNEGQMLVRRDRYFQIGHVPVYFLWGVSAVDRSGTNSFDEDDLGRLVYDEAFDPARPEAQRALLHGCMEPTSDPGLLLASGSSLCVLRAFADWSNASHQLSWPLPTNEFASLLGEFLDEQPHWRPSVGFGPDGRVRSVIAQFYMEAEMRAPASQRHPTFAAWQRTVARLNAAAPPSAGRVIQTAGPAWSPYWTVMATQDLLQDQALAVLGVSIIASGGIILLATRSLRITPLCLLTVGAVVANFIALMVVWGFTLSMVESVVLMVSVGLMLDPLTHIAHAFAEAPGTAAQRLEAALRNIGNGHGMHALQSFSMLALHPLASSYPLAPRALNRGLTRPAPCCFQQESRCSRAPSRQRFAIGNRTDPAPIPLPFPALWVRP